MDPSAAINSSASNPAFHQTDLSGLPRSGASQQAFPRVLYKALPLIPLSILLQVLRPLFAPLSINLDRLLLLEQKMDGQEVEAAVEAEVADEPAIKCPICLGAYVRPTAIKVCGHVFCGACLAESMENFKKCPTCNTKATKKQLLKIYL
ncbi:E3 ubiquitin-protein ligase BRE1-like [Apium graveolens]|uniref:E3 ubiquitin-protein ligase BRE1-like n=1 Tax=Apium graveolens TaxID=4045 RepID=UPI003D78D542